MLLMLVTVEEPQTKKNWFQIFSCKEPTDTLACVECKNWAQDLPLKDLIDILSKSLDKPECAF